jgi:hypothetical protein
MMINKRNYIEGPVWHHPTITGWWLAYPSEKYDFVSWDDDMPNIWKNKIHVPNHQPDNYIPKYTIIICILSNYHE